MFLKKVFNTILLLGITSATLAIPPSTLRVAVIGSEAIRTTIDTPNYKKAYVDGFTVAIDKFKKENIKIDLKYFNYGSNPLNIFKAVDAAKQWDPSLIVGPKNSNEFLLIKQSFKHTLVISTFANAFSLKQLPDNYYTLTPKESRFAATSANYLLKKYPKKGAFIIVERGCRSCIDFSNAFSATYLKAKRPSATHYFLSSNITQLDPQGLLNGYQKGDIIVLSSTANNAFILIVELLSTLNYPITFIGDDNWGVKIAAQVNKIPALRNNFTALRFSTWSLDGKSLLLKQFKRNYMIVFHQGPAYTISFANYKIIASVIAALKRNHALHPGLISAKSVEESYLKAREKSPHWFQEDSVSVFKTHGDQTENYMTAIKVL